MVLTAGTLSIQSSGSNSAQLISTAATGGTGPYTVQWYRSTTDSFSPGGGNIISGATSLTLNNTGLIPDTVYYYKVVYTDTGHSNDTVTSSQLTVTTSSASQSISQFSQAPFLGQLDLTVGPANVISVIISSNNGTTYGARTLPAYAGSWTTMDTDSPAPKGGLPWVYATLDALGEADPYLGPIVYDIKNPGYIPGDRCEIAMDGCCMWLYASEVILRGDRVCVSLTSPGSVIAYASGGTGAAVVGWAYDGAAAPGDLIRVMLATRSLVYKP